MKQTKYLLIILFFISLLFIAGCGERTTIYLPTAEAANLLKPGESLDVLTLQIVSVAFDSADPDGAITVRWEAEGDFGEGFMMAWDPTNPAPMPGQHGWVAITDSEVREVQVKLTEKVPHYFRICHVKDNVCDVFSETIKVVFPTDEMEGVNEEDQQVTKTLVATPTLAEDAPTPTATTAPQAEIQIESITTSDDGIVTVSWKVLSGSAPLGFRVNWSHTTTNPTDKDEGMKVPDENARSVEIEGFGRGNEYSFSVCQLTVDGCTGTSAGVTYKVPPEPTKTPSKTPAVTNTPLPDDAGLVLTSLTETGTGQVKVDWTASGSFPKGFKIVWSKTSDKPVYPGDSYAYISDATVRSGYIKELTPGTKYYFRVCRYNGSTCDLYSNTKSITLSGSDVESTITLTSISDAGSCAAKLIWTATGTFPNGFKIAYSSSNQKPVYPGDSYVYVSSGSSRSVIIDNLAQGKTYYFRVCKYEGGGCSVYSNVKSYVVPCEEKTATPAPTKEPAPTATPDGSTISLNSVAAEGGGIRVNWSAAGSFPNGFKIIWSDVHAAPVFPGDSYYYEDTPTATTVFLEGFDAGTTYHFRICKFFDGACTIYSNAFEYTFP